MSDAKSWNVHFAVPMHMRATMCAEAETEAEARQIVVDHFKGADGPSLILEDAETKFYGGLEGPLYHMDVAIKAPGGGSLGVHPTILAVEGPEDLACAQAPDSDYQRALKAERELAETRVMLTDLLLGVSDIIGGGRVPLTHNGITAALMAAKKKVRA